MPLLLQVGDELHKMREHSYLSNALGYDLNNKKNITKNDNKKFNSKFSTIIMLEN